MHAMVHDMLSLISLLQVVVALYTGNQQPLGALPTIADWNEDICGYSPLSCHNSSTVEDLCCFNAPGGTLLLTQFWDAHPATGPDDSWTVHGLWPDNCDGSYAANCDDTRAYRNITDILKSSGHGATLEYMQTYWKDYQGHDETFWQHEWSKHGTCVSTLEPSCFSSYLPTQEVPLFFHRTIELFKALPTYNWLAAENIVPSATQTYTSQQIQEALSKHFDDREIRLGCHNGALNEIWYFYNVRGSVQAGTFVPTDMIGARHTCPQSGVKYLPKHNSAGPPHSTTTASSPGPTSKPEPSDPFTGRGQLYVITGGNEKGCVISGGAWYVSGTCATFTASKDGDGFTLKSSRGTCGYDDGQLSCGRNVNTSTFKASGSDLLMNGGDHFYADKAPNGRSKASIYLDSAHDVSLQIEWRQ